jgi:hypothetical protein
MNYPLRRFIMPKFNRVARGVTLCASLAIVAVIVAAVPLKPAAADNDSNNGQWRNRGHDQQHYDRNWYGGGGYYRAPTYYYASPPTYYYQPAPTYYQPYYQPRPVYGQPGINLNVVIP